MAGTPQVRVRSEGTRAMNDESLLADIALLLASSESA